MVDTMNDFNERWYALTAEQREEIIEIAYSTTFSVYAVLKAYYDNRCDSEKTRSYLERVLLGGE